MIRLLTLVLLLSFTGLAYGDGAQFFIITENGNIFNIFGPPPARPPGFDSAPFLNAERINTAISVTTGSDAVFGQAGSITTLPAASSMRAAIITDWGTASDELYSAMLVGELHKTTTGQPYLGDGVISGGLDLLEYCNLPYNSTLGLGVDCVNNYNGNDMTPVPRYGHGYVLEGIPPVGRAIVNVDVLFGKYYEVMFTCPGCTDESRAYFIENVLSMHQFGDAGFRDSPGLTFTPDAPFKFDQTTLAGLALVPGTNQPGRDANNIGAWNCTATDCDYGSIYATKWKSLLPGWNSIQHGTPGNFAIITIDPGTGAKLQLREGNSTDGSCCFGFDGGLYNHIGSAAVIHDTDRHVMIVPNGGSIPHENPIILDEQKLQQERLLNTQVGSVPRQFSHSQDGDPLYNGLYYDENGSWPPYHVRLVDAVQTDFSQKPFNINDYLGKGNYTNDDMIRILRGSYPINDPMDSEIYDIRNDVMLRGGSGTFQYWDGDDVKRPYIDPWMRLQKNPVWEEYGVTLPQNSFVIVDTYATIPVVKPTRLSDTYLSSTPCGLPGTDEVNRLNVIAASNSGGYDASVIEFLVLADGSGPIETNLKLQLIYEASRTYLDYIDGNYLAGDSIHVPILPNRPYLCTIIAPNILESQFLLATLPHGQSYISLGGIEGVVPVSAEYVQYMGVQSPRDGTISLDISSRIGASVSAFGKGPIGANNTQWTNGSIPVLATITVKGNESPLLSFSIDTFDIIEEEYNDDGANCYGRFVTDIDSSTYVQRTVSIPASLGEHIPIELKIITQDTLTDIPFCGGVTKESILIQYILHTFAIDVR